MPLSCSLSALLNLHHLPTTTLLFSLSHYCHLYAPTNGCHFAHSPLPCKSQWVPSLFLHLFFFFLLVFFLLFYFYPFLASLSSPSAMLQSANIFQRYFYTYLESGFYPWFDFCSYHPRDAFDFLKSLTLEASRLGP